MPLFSPQYRYVTTELYQPGNDPNPVISELPFTDVTFTQQLNSIGTFQGHVLLSGFNTSSLNVFAGTTPGKTILYVLYEDGGISTPIWSGVIWQREYNSDTQTLRVSAQEMISLYQKRKITSLKQYVSQDPMSIAQDLLTYAENKTHGKTGLAYFNPGSPFSRSQTYQAYEYKSVYQAIKDLSQNLFDFAIIPSNYLGGNFVNTFTMGYPLGTVYDPNSALSPVFQFPGNIISYTFPEDATGSANTLYGLGSGASNNKLSVKAIDYSKIGTATITYADGYGTFVAYSAANKFVVGESVRITGVNPPQYNGTYNISMRTNLSFTVQSTAVGAYISGGVASTDWPLLEETTNFIDIGDAQLLSDLTLGQLNAISYPPTTIEVVVAPYVDPYYSTYSIGQQVRLDITDDFFPNGLKGLIMRIVGISVSPGENGPARITLTLTRDLSSGVIG
jgi:hypothetical protein